MNEENGVKELRKGEAKGRTGKRNGEGKVGRGGGKEGRGRVGVIWTPIVKLWLHHCLIRTSTWWFIFRILRTFFLLSSIYTICVIWLAIVDPTNYGELVTDRFRLIAFEAVIIVTYERTKKGSAGSVLGLRWELISSLWNDPGSWKRSSSQPIFTDLAFGWSFCSSVAAAGTEAIQCQVSIKLSEPVHADAVREQIMSRQA